MTRHKAGHKTRHKIPGTGLKGFTIPVSMLFVLWGFSLLGGCGDGKSGSAAKDKGPEALVINFYNWSDYIAPDTLPNFEAKTGIHVNYDIFDSNEMLEGKMLAGSTGYDIVVPSGDFFEIQRMAGLFQKLDLSKLKNYGNLDPDLMKAISQFDPGNQYGVPYMWGTDGLGYNVDKVKARIPDAPLDSWDLLFKPENARRLADCGIAVLDAADEIQSVTLIYLGIDPQTTKRADIEKGMALVAKIRPYIRYFHSSQYIDDLANGEICLALGWSGDVSQARRDARAGVNIHFTIPREGTVMWFDIMAIPVDAPHPNNAYKLIDYLLDPHVAANNANATWYATPVKAAMPYIDKKVRNDPMVYPTPEIMKRLQPDRAATPKIIRIRNRIWTRVKTGH